MTQETTSNPKKIVKYILPVILLLLSFFSGMQVEKLKTHREEITKELSGPGMLNKEHMFKKLESLKGPLEMTPEQENKIRQIIESGSEQAQQLRKKYAPEARGLVRNLRKQVGEVLTVEQRRKFKKMRGRFSNRLHDQPDQEQQQAQPEAADENTSPQQSK